MQAEAIEAQCKLKGWELVELIVERGRSAGEGKKRPGLDRARKLIRTGEARGLVVWKIDRCSRSVRDFAEILAELRHHDAEFVSVTESFDTSNAMGRAMLQITMVFAELERARMGERAAAWQAYRAKQGGTPTTRAILGYRRVDGQLLLDEQTAPIVKQAVEILLGTGSLSAAAGVLRDSGHPKYLSAARSLLSSHAGRRPLRRRCLRSRGMAGTHRRGDARGGPCPVRRSAPGQQGATGVAAVAVDIDRDVWRPRLRAADGRRTGHPSGDVSLRPGTQTVHGGPAVRPADRSRRARRLCRAAAARLGDARHVAAHADPTPNGGRPGRRRRRARSEAQPARPRLGARQDHPR